MASHEYPQQEKFLYFFIENMIYLVFYITVSQLGIKLGEVVEGAGLKGEFE